MALPPAYGIPSAQPLLAVAPYGQFNLRELERGGIYRIRHDIPGGKFYVGSAKNFRIRWNIHRSDLRRGKNASAYLQHAWSKHGENAFVWEVLEYVADPGELVVREQRWIDGLGAHVTRGGLNMLPNAGSPLGTKHSEETRAKFRAIAAARPPEHYKKVVASKKASGWTHSAEARAKLGDAARGRKLTPDHVAKVAAANRGKKRGPEALARMREGYRLRTDLAKAKYGIGSHPQSDATRVKISLKNRGKKISQEVRSRISAGRKAFLRRQKQSVIAPSAQPTRSRPYQLVLPL